MEMSYRLKPTRPSQQSEMDTVSLARDLIEHGRLLEAFDHLSTLLSKNNQIPDVFFLLSEIYIRSGQFTRGKEALKQTLELDPTFTEASISLSALLNDMGDYAQARDVFTRAQERVNRAPIEDPFIRKGLAKSHYELGKSYAQVERFGEAVRELRQAVSLSSSEPNAFLLLAKCLQAQNQIGPASEVLREGLNRHPEAFELQVQLGLLFYLEKNLDRAETEWRDVVRKKAGHETALRYLSLLAEKTRD